MREGRGRWAGLVDHGAAAGYEARTLTETRPRCLPMPNPFR
jgi:hypothetical protein